MKNYNDNEGIKMGMDLLDYIVIGVSLIFI